MFVLLLKGVGYIVKIGKGKNYRETSIKGNNEI